MQLTRQTPERIAAYVASGHWTPEATIDFWARNAGARPEAPALADAERDYSWAEGWRVARAIAAGLVAAGLPRDAIVVVHAPGSALLALFRLACELAGVLPAFVPAAGGAAELGAIAARLAPTAALLDVRGRDDAAALRQLLAGHLDGRAPWTVEEEGDGAPSLAALAAGPADADFADRRVRPYEMTAIVTSSGSTGLPKCLEYACWARLANGRVYIERLGIGPRDTVLSCLPCYSGGGDMQYHVTPQAGARLVYLARFDPGETLAALARERATGAVMVPTMIARLAGRDDLAEHDLAALRWVVSNGSMLPYDIAARFEAATGAKIIQGYGMMDFGGIASHAVGDAQERRLHGSGRLLPGTEFRVVASDGISLPRGATGELLVRGPHGSGGRIGGGDDDAWQDGYYRTGDLAQVDDDDWVTLVGRVKDVIIRGGRNIHAAEVEALLCRHAAVVEAAVVGIPDADLGERACAFVVLRAGAKLDFAVMAAFMKAQGIAIYKIPERLETLAALPMTAAGIKVDKRALAARLAAAPGEPQ